MFLSKINMSKEKDYSAGEAWSEIYSGKYDLFYPAEYVVRIFKGQYPNLTWERSFENKSILDIGCGDGRHVLFFKSLGMNAHGLEISEEIASQLRSNLKDLDVRPEEIHAGSCSKLPFEDNSFDYLMGWNSVYYMSLDDSKFEDHVNEMTRVLKPGGYLILSIPKDTAFIFDKSEFCKDTKYKIIKDDYYDGMRNGEIMRVFKSRSELKEEFLNLYEDFNFGEISDDCFGLNFHWHLMIAKKK